MELNVIGGLYCSFYYSCNKLYYINFAHLTMLTDGKPFTASAKRNTKQMCYTPVTLITLQKLQQKRTTCQVNVQAYLWIKMQAWTRGLCHGKWFTCSCSSSKLSIAVVIISWVTTVEPSVRKFAIYYFKR